FLLMPLLVLKNQKLPHNPKRLQNNQIILGVKKLALKPSFSKRSLKTRKGGDSCNWLLPIYAGSKSR
ncbi:hypothetical protein J7M23_09285, partial [Candidatus Sumerlaeota bacterium]|nr:hypothetical protein [Candidatus Sumerlaeota bacterium]